MSSFLKDMESLPLYNELQKHSKNSKKKSSLLDDDPVQMQKLKSSSGGSGKSSGGAGSFTTFKADNLRSSELSNYSKGASFSTKGNDLSLQGKMISQSVPNMSGSFPTQSKGASAGSSGSGALGGYGAPMSFSGGSSLPAITQFGLVKMTGTEGKLSNGYTIGSEASSRATASINYITREENGKEIAELKDKDGLTISKEQAKQELEKIAAERRLVLSPNPKVKITDQELDKIVKETMSSYSESFGKGFNFYYAIHNNTSVKHAHVLMTTNDPTGDGIKMFKDELFELKMHFEQNLKQNIEHTQNYKDETALPYAKQIGNFIGAVPDTNMFRQNKNLAYNMSKKFDISYDPKTIGNDPQKLSQWFDQNKQSYDKYFMGAQNKEAFLFKEYMENAEQLDKKYDLGLDKNIKGDVNKFGEWMDDKKELFLADRISKDQNITLSKEQATDEKKLYSWFKSNEQEVKHWNEKYKMYPSKQLASLANKYGSKVDLKPENLHTSRTAARDFVRNYTKDPLQYANYARKSTYEVLEVKKDQYKNELKNERIHQKTFDNEFKRLDTLQERLIQGHEISTQSLAKYNINTQSFITNVKEIELDGIDLNDKEVKEKLQDTIEEHKDKLSENYENKQIDKEYFKEYNDKAKKLEYVLKGAKNISVSSLENIGIDKQDLKQEFDITKIKTALDIIDFKSTADYQNASELLADQEQNKSNPLKHQVQRIDQISRSTNTTPDKKVMQDYKTANKWIDENKDRSLQRTHTRIRSIEDMVKEDMQKASDGNTSYQNEQANTINTGNYKEILSQFEQNSSGGNIDYKTLDDLLDAAIQNKDLESVEKIIEYDKETFNDNFKIEILADTLGIEKDEVFGSLLEKHSDIFSNEDINKLDNKEAAFRSELELKETTANLDDLVELHFKNELTDLVAEKYEQQLWSRYDMDNENVSEDNMKNYFENLEKVNEETQRFKEGYEADYQSKQLEDQIILHIDNSNFNKAAELMEDERLNENTRTNLQLSIDMAMSSEDVLDEVYENILDRTELEQKTYETYEEEYNEEMAKLDVFEKEAIDIEQDIEDEMTLGR